MEIRWKLIENFTTDYADKISVIRVIRGVIFQKNALSYVFYLASNKNALSKLLSKSFYKIKKMQTQTTALSLDAYFEFEYNATERHEYTGVSPRAFAYTSVNHGRIVSNIFKKC